MKITNKKVTIREIINGYENRDELGVVAYGGKLNVRPAYQRLYVYTEKQSVAVINSIMNGFPLSSFYWSKNKVEGFEILDGQQRTMSICEFVKGKFFYNGKTYDGQSEEFKEQFLNYELLIYVCDGTEEEKLNWFRVINIAGEPLSEQELRNAAYVGPWLASAKAWFSKTNCAEANNSKGFTNAKVNRQELLEQALYWITNGRKNGIEEYMAQHQFFPAADELVGYFNQVMSWAKSLFGKHLRKEMLTQQWGLLYNKYGKNQYDAEELEITVSKLMKDDEVTKKSGIYEYLFDGDEKHLSLRAFPESMKRTVYEQQNHKCAMCGKEIAWEDAQADHCDPWSKGGKTTIENCVILCRRCNGTKSNK